MADSPALTAQEQERLAAMRARIAPSRTLSARYVALSSTKSSNPGVRMKPRQVGLALCLLVALLLASPAIALAAEPLNFTSLTPAEGASVPVGRQVSFEMRSNAGYPVSPSIEVSTQPTLGQDGTLANDYLVDQALYLGRSDADPTAYRGATATNARLGWIGTPGTYYWQVRVSYEEYKPGAPGSVAFHDAIGPVQRLVIEHAPLTRAEAVDEVPSIIRDETGRRPQRLHRSCFRSGVGFACSLRWATSRRLRKSTTLYIGRLRMEADRDDLVYGFVGRRWTHGCEQRRGKRACSRAVRW